MHDAMNDAQTGPGPGMLPPVEALRRGFRLDGQHAPTGTALAAAYAGAATPVGPGQQDGLQREGFLIGHLGLMIRYEDGSELSELPTTYRLPKAPGWFTGVANLHGLLVPVFDLASYLDVERQPGAKPMLLVLGHGADAAGVVIDGLPVRLRYTLGDRAEGAPVPAALDGCVNHTWWADGRTWMDLQVQALLTRLSDQLEALGQ